MTTGQDSSRDIVHTREQLESLPVGTTLVDKWGDPLVKVDSCCFAIVNTDRATPGLPCGPEPWRYYDMAEVCGEITDVSWLPMAIHQIPDQPAAVPPGRGESPAASGVHRVARPPLLPPDARALSDGERRSEQPADRLSPESGVRL